MITILVDYFSDGTGITLILNEQISSGLCIYIGVLVYYNVSIHMYFGIYRYNMYYVWMFDWWVLEMFVGIYLYTYTP